MTVKVETKKAPARRRHFRVGVFLTGQAVFWVVVVGLVRALSGLGMRPAWAIVTGLATPILTFPLLARYFRLERWLWEKGGDT